MKYFLALLLFVLSLNNSAAQESNNPAFDALSQKIKQTQNRDSIFFYLNKQEAIAKKADDKTLLAQVLRAYANNSTYDGLLMEKYYREGVQNQD